MNGKPRLGASPRRADVDDALVDSQLLMQIAGKLAKVGGWVLDVHANRVTWSDEVFDIIECPRGRMPTWREGLHLYPPGDRAQLVEALRACQAEGVPIDLELQVDTVTGRRRTVRVVAEARWGPDGRVRRITGACQDVTDARRAQAEQAELVAQALRAQRIDCIGDLASGVAHDLNNVLTPIILSVHMLQQEEVDPVRQQLLSTIARSAERGAEMVKQVLGFASGIEGERRPVDVGELLRDVHRILADTFPKSVELEMALAEEVPPVLAQPTQLHQVLVNLAVNARDAMAPDGGRLVLRTGTELSTEAAGDGRSVVIEVEDTGPGMPPEVLSRIFEPFFTTKGDRGTGLGLSTSHSIITGHGGVMAVDSRVGEGTTFRITLPVAEPTDPQDPQPSDISRGVGPRRGQGELVLVADDEPAVRDLTRRTLQANGYEVLEAADGAQAVAQLARHRERVAAVVIDLGMPVMDGLTTIPVLRALRTDLPVVLASGVAEVGGGCGPAQAYLPKPYGGRQLLQALEVALLRTPVDPVAAGGSAGASVAGVGGR